MRYNESIQFGDTDYHLGKPGYFNTFGIVISPVCTNAEYKRTPRYKERSSSGKAVAIQILMNMISTSGIWKISCNRSAPKTVTRGMQRSPETSSSGRTIAIWLSRDGIST